MVSPVVDDLPMDTSQLLFHFNENALAYAGLYVHNKEKRLQAHGYSGPHQAMVGISFAWRSSRSSAPDHASTKVRRGKPTVLSDQLNSRSMTSAPRRSSGTITFR